VGRLTRRPPAPRPAPTRARCAAPGENGARFNTPDANYDGARLAPGSGTEKRAFTYFVLGGARFLYASAARLAVINAVATLSASADVLALAAVEVDLANIQLGQTITVKWRGKPVFIKHRTAEQIAEVAAPVADLRDQQTDAQRVKQPEWLIVLGVCTHLGCVPIPNAGDYNGWYCPCHGSHYDGSGRIRRGPAPLNLEIPEYKFVGDNKLLLG
jgi:ubiquinol-cytochrome c reductase iron-sulfur subunit